MTAAALLMLLLAGARGIAWPRDATAWLQVGDTGVATTWPFGEALSARQGVGALLLGAAMLLLARRSAPD